METSLELTIEEFKKLDMREVCQNSGAILKENSEGQVIVIKFLSSEYSITCAMNRTATNYLPDIEITSAQEKVGTETKITILHYLITSKASKGTPLTGKLVDFRQVPGGNFYYSTLIKLVHKPFLETFGEKPQVFVSAGKSIGGNEADFKDFSMKFQVFPNVPVIVVLYKGDEEFPPDCKFLFDSNIVDYLSAEGILKACEELIKKLRRDSG